MAATLCAALLLLLSLSTTVTTVTTATHSVTTATHTTTPAVQYDCYDQECTGSDVNKTVIQCNQATHFCSNNETTGLPTCNSTASGQGINCTAGVEHYCSANDTGAALCMYPPKHDCYNTLCQGTGDYSNTTIPCLQSRNRCVVNSTTGLPTCVNTTRGAGVNCPHNSPLDFYCTTNDTGVASCSYTPVKDCYSTACKGKDTFQNIHISCDQSVNRCTVNETGYPLCANTSRGAGVNCPHNSPLDFHCQANDTGEVACQYTWISDCAASRCRGNGQYSTYTVPCNQTLQRCDTDMSGYPTCSGTSRGTGVNCTADTGSYHCAQDKYKAEASCVYKSNTTLQCYNDKCSGVLSYSNTTIGCNQEHAYCDTGLTGFPLCISSDTFSGDGVSCNGSFSCRYAANTGLASCHRKGLSAVWGAVIGCVVGLVIVVVALLGVKQCMAARNTGERQGLIGTLG